MPCLSFDSLQLDQKVTPSAHEIKMTQNWQRKYTRAILPILSKIINLKIERGEFKPSEYEGMLDNLNKYIVLSLDESAIKFEKPVPRLTCDCFDCR